MNKKSLSAGLNRWVAAGIIDEGQRSSILAHEEHSSGGARTRWALYGFLILGVSIIGIGLISLIAANWQHISGGAKLFFDFTFLAGVAALALFLDRTGRDILYDATLSFFGLLVLASIGLISQIFHTGGALYQAIFFWAAITFPLGLFSKKGFFPYLWVAGFIGALALWSASAASWWQGYDEDETIASLIMTLPFLCFFLCSAMNRARPLALYARAFAQWTIVCFLAMVLLTDIYLSTKEVDLSAGLLAPAGVFALLSLGALFSEKQTSLKEKITVLILMVSAALPYLPLLVSLEITPYRSGNQLQGALYSITMLLLLSVLFIIKDRKKLFNAATMLAGFRFLVVYFQVFGDLAATGLGLIFSGMIIIGVALLWFKQRDRLERIIRKLIGAKPHDGTE
jgi:uncharacterized membrane protein